MARRRCRRWSQYTARAEGVLAFYLVSLASVVLFILQYSRGVIGAIQILSPVLIFIWILTTPVAEERRGLCYLRRLLRLFAFQAHTWPTFYEVLGSGDPWLPAYQVERLYTASRQSLAAIH